MHDKIIRDRTSDVPVPEFEATAFTSPPSLKEATVAIVTTAGLQRPFEKGWKPGDQSFRVFASEERDLITSHLSPNFDRIGLTTDLNVAYPAKRLKELEIERLIKAAPATSISRGPRMKRWRRCARTPVPPWPGNRWRTG